MQSKLEIPDLFKLPKKTHCISHPTSFLFLSLYKRFLPLLVPSPSSTWHLLYVIIFYIVYCVLLLLLLLCVSYIYIYIYNPLRLIFWVCIISGLTTLHLATNKRIDSYKKLILLFPMDIYCLKFFLWIGSSAIFCLHY